MVIDVTSNNMSIDEFFHNIDLEVQQAVHETEYSILAYKYNYLQENGCVLEADGNTNKKSIISHIKNFFAAIGRALKKIKDIIINKIKEVISKLKKNKEAKRQERIKKHIKKCFDMAEALSDSFDKAVDDLDSTQEKFEDKIDDMDDSMSEAMEHLAKTAQDTAQSIYERHKEVSETIAESLKAIYAQHEEFDAKKTEIDQMLSDLNDSAERARENGVKEDDILKGIDDIDHFFMD